MLVLLSVAYEIQAAQKSQLSALDPSFSHFQNPNLSIRNLIFAGAVLVAKVGCWSLLSAGYQIQAVPNSVDVRLQGITNQDIWLHAVSIISVPKNLYLNDLAARTAAVSS